IGGWFQRRIHTPCTDPLEAPRYRRMAEDTSRLNWGRGSMRKFLTLGALAASALLTVGGQAQANGCNGVVDQGTWGCAFWDSDNGPQFPQYKGPAKPAAPAHVVAPPKPQAPPPSVLQHNSGNSLVNTNGGNVVGNHGNGMVSQGGGNAVSNNGSSAKPGS